MKDDFQKFLKSVGNDGLDQYWKQSKERLPERARLRFSEEIFGLGPLRDLIERSEVTEISINHPSHIYFLSNGRFYRHNSEFLSPWSYQHFIDRMLSEASCDLSPQNPFCDFHWKGFRVHLVHQSITGKSPSTCFRRLRNSPYSFDQLGLRQSAMNSQLKYLVHQRNNILIIGGVGSGKTTLLESLLADSNDRCIVIEDTQELSLPNDNSIRMVVQRQPCPVNQTELVRQSLRMHPDRIILGEIRGAEAKDYLNALSTGHKGSLATLHADTPQQALLRLELLIQQASTGWTTRMIQQLLFLSVDFVVKIENKKGDRYLESLHRVAALEASGILLDPVGSNI